MNKISMKTYDSERKALFEWLLEKGEECRKIDEQEKPQGYDSRGTYLFRLYVREYNEKLKALKEKYNES